MTLADEPTRMIALTVPSVASGGRSTAGAAARGDAPAGAAAFAALVGAGDPGIVGPGIVGPVSTSVDAPRAAASERQDDAVAGDSVPVDAGGDPSWLAAMLASTAAIGQPVASAPAPAVTTATPAIDGGNATRPGTSAASAVPPLAIPTAVGSPSALPATDAAARAPVVANRKPSDESDAAVQPDTTPPLVAIDPATAVVAPQASPTSAAVIPDPRVAHSPVIVPQAASAAVPAAAPVANNDRVTPATAPLPVATIVAPAPPPGMATPTSPAVQDASGSTPSRIAAASAPIEPPAPFAITTPRNVAPAAVSAAAPPIIPFAATPPSAPGAVAPAGEVFAAAIHAAGQRPDRPEGSESSLLQTFAPSAAAPIVAPAASGGNADSSLDMRRDHWPSAMIDHIEKLRDAADAVDTRIRVVPDALGGIDVSLRRHDDGVQISLRADHAATQAMLAEARPQLAAMAEARGIRLADVDPSGAGSSGSLAGDPSTANGRQQPRASMPSAPASAGATPDTLDAADGRVA